MRLENFYEIFTSRINPEAAKGGSRDIYISKLIRVSRKTYVFLLPLAKIESKKGNLDKESGIGQE